jgi:hypothetical protein
MALQKNIKIEMCGKNIEFNNAYIKIKNFNGDKNRILFFTKTLNEKDGELITESAYDFDYNINGENPIKQAYLHLKTLPEFAGATDC